MSSFLVSNEEVKRFSDTPLLQNMNGIFYLYETKEEIVKKILPPPLEFVTPIVIGYFINFTNTNFGGPYMEFMIGVPASYKGQPGIYPLSLLLCGHGAEMAVIVGTNCVGFPKKLADHMEFERNGRTVKCRMDRHGVTIFECTADIDGAYNRPEGANVLAISKPGDTVHGGYFIHHLNYLQTEQGNIEFLNVDLVELFTEHTVKSFEPGKLTDIRVVSSADDALGELEVVAPMAAAYFKTEGITMKSTKMLEALEPERALPYLMTARFDRGMFGDPIEFQKNISAKN